MLNINNFIINLKEIQFLDIAERKAEKKCTLGAGKKC